MEGLEVRWAEDEGVVAVVELERVRDELAMG
jgi:hypothetical protein